MTLKFYPAILFLLVVSLTLSCKKDSPNSTLPDDITFHEFDPNIEINNIDSFGILFPYPGCLPGIPIPGDSIATYELDVNSDNHSDLLFKVQHVPNPNGFSTLYPCSNFVSQMSIISTNNTQFSKFYSENESINGDNNNEWSGSFSLAGYYTPNFSDIRYVGFRVKNGNHYNYGWLKLKKITESNKHGLILLSYGYNNTVSNSILAGQEH